MLLIDTVAKPSAIHGLGCFANQPIGKGQLIWRFDRTCDIFVRESQLSRYPDAFQKYLLNAGYVERYLFIRWIVLCGDNARYMNHWDVPNTTDNRACRDIAVGEELTVNYFSYDLHAERKLFPEGRHNSARDTSSPMRGHSLSARVASFEP